MARTSLVEVDEAKKQLKIRNDDTDFELTQWIAALNRAVEDKIGLVIEPRAVTERLRLTGRPTFRVWHRPVISLTSLTAVTSWTLSYDVANLSVDGTTGVVDVVAGTPPYGIVDVEYQAGFTDIPESYAKGALIVLQHVWESKRGGTGGVGPGVIGAEERYDHQYGNYTIPRKAMELFPDPAPSVG